MSGRGEPRGARAGDDPRRGGARGQRGRRRRYATSARADSQRPGGQGSPARAPRQDLDTSPVLRCPHGRQDVGAPNSLRQFSWLGIKRRYGTKLAYPAQQRRLIIPLQRALKHRGAPENDSGRDKGAGDRQCQGPQPEATTAGTENAQPTPAPQASLLSLIPLSEEGDYPSELIESLPRERGNSPPLNRGHSLLPSALRDTELGIPGNRSRDWHARLAELIGRGAGSEQE